MCSDHSTAPFYSVLQRRLHWLVIVLVAIQYLSQDAMRDALHAIEQQVALGFTQFLVTTVHTWGGAGIAALMLWRWRLRRKKVALNGGLMAHKKARWVTFHHICLYISVWFMATTGALHYYLSWPPAARWHELGKWMLLVLIAIHVLGALSHLGGGNTVLRRMMGRDSLR